ncbi:hypothetical protein [Bdellovibrio sp. BCCA]|uniref:hypothetical protein n=1 Tax=Bdellovibrio sp. BCCA TaxID=3136281 RepID=UPI0030F0C2D0
MSSSTYETSTVGAGVQKTLVILLNFPTSKQVCTKSQVDSLMFSGSSSVNKYYQENSFGKVGFQGTVTEAMTIAAPAYCDLNSLSSSGDAVATQAGYDLNLFQKRVYVLPPNSLKCGWTGAAFTGGNKVFIDSSGCSNSMVYAHELGHSLGMNHASSAGGEYADHSDVMGDPSSTPHFNSVHKIAMGWIPSSRIANMSGMVGTIADYRVAHLEQDVNDLQAVKVPIVGTTDSYYLSYRRGLGFDSILSSGFLDSISVHRAGLGTRSYLVGTVKAGEVWIDPTGAFKVQLLSRDTTYGNVHIEVSTPDVTAPSVPLNLQASVKTVTSGKGRRAVTTTVIHLSWSSSNDDRGVQKYLIERNGILYTVVPGAAFDDSYLLQGMSYTYRIQAVDYSGNISDYSLPVTVGP